MADDQKYLFENLPSDLKASHSWLVWKYGTAKNGKGKWPKEPCDPEKGFRVDRKVAARLSFMDAVALSPESCSAERNPTTKFDGIGLFAVGPLIGVDLDNCVDEVGVVSDFAKKVVQHCNSYTELSPSRKGLRIWVRGNAPEVTEPSGAKHKRVVKDGPIEIYPAAPDHSNYLTCTGWKIPGSPDHVRDLTDEKIQELYAFSQTDERKQQKHTTVRLTPIQRFNCLSRGQWRELYPSQSEADLAYCGFLADIHNGDPKKIDSDFRQSQLMRKKWDERHGAGTYGEMTIALALKDFKPKAAPKAPLVFHSAKDFLQKEFKKRQPIVVTQARQCPVFHKLSINEIHAWRGVGKTNLGIGLTKAIATAGKFLAWEVPTALRVLYVEGELPGEDAQDRVRNLLGDLENVFLITPEQQPDGFISPISTSEGRALIEEALAACQADVLFVDSISTLAAIATNDEENWIEITNWFMRLRIAGYTVFWMMHDGKAGAQRGHSRAEDNSDKVVHLTHEDGDHGVEGLKFRLAFDKARQPVKEAANLLVELIEKPDGGLEWACETAGKQMPKKMGRPTVAEDVKQQVLLDFKRGESVEALADKHKKNEKTIRRWIQSTEIERTLENPLEE